MKLEALRRLFRRESVRPGLYNPEAGRLLTVEEWELGGGWNRLRPGWTVERRVSGGGSVAVTAATVEEARARLDEMERE